MSTNEKMNGMTVALVVSVVVIIIGICIGVSTLISKYIKHVVKVDDVTVAEIKVPEGGPIEAPKPKLVARGGKEFYDVSCKACHGANGEGLVGPNLTILSDDYLKKQYDDIMTGKRKSDLATTMVTTIQAAQKGRDKAMAEKEVQAALDYIKGLPHAKSPTENLGDAAKGQASYAMCLACHGPNGQGNPALKAPAIGGQKEKYTFDQVMAIKSGARVTIPEGLAMKAVTAALTEQQIKDIAAYVNTLSGK